MVITDLRHEYNPNDGVFTAPTAGVYVFFVNVQSYNILSVYVDVVVNGARKVRTMASNHYDAGPNMAVLTLLKQDRVWVKRYSGQPFRGFSLDKKEKNHLLSKLLHYYYFEFKNNCIKKVCNFFNCDINTVL